MVKITFPDGTVKEFDNPTGEIIANSISEGLGRAAIAIIINDQLQDLTQNITKDSKIQIITFKDEIGKEIFRHSSSHVLSQAVNRLYKNVKQGVGPAIEDGFYQDFELEASISQEDLGKIEEEMKKIVKEKLEFKKQIISKEEAKELFKNDPYKLELIEDLNEVTIYTSGEYSDLCKGPHVPNTGKIKSFKLTQVAAAYWKGDSKNKQLTRIYGTSFPDKKELKQHLDFLEEARKRDHNKLGRDMDLFITHSAIGQGLPLLTPRGAKIMQLLQRWVEDEEEKRGYTRTVTPLLAKKELYEISGHWDHYKDGMFVMNVEGAEMALRPMTCPYQFMIYKSKKRSYRELPIRYSETSPLFRNESSGEMHGLIRVRQFTLSEGHIICRPDQLEKEFKKVIELIDYILKTLGLTDFKYRFSKWDPNNKEKYIDNPEAWESSQKQMKEILNNLKLDYTEADGEAAFYGPKLDIQMKNVYGKEDTIITVQIDFALPERFDMNYTDKDNKEKKPMVIHRSSIGCYERTIALLIEKYAGKFPLWLNPEQVRILTIADRHKEYAEEVKKQLEEQGIRVTIDSRTETMNKKIREGELSHTNYLCVVGDKELENKTLNIRTRDNEVLGEMPIDKFLEKLKEEVNNKK